MSLCPIRRGSQASGLFPLHSRVLKVARTIAALDGSGGVRRVHIAQTLSYLHMPVFGMPTALGQARTH